MEFSSMLLALYPCYLSLEIIRKPRNQEMKHLLVLWVTWYIFGFISIILNTMFFWLPFISIFETLRLFCLIAIIREDIAEQIRSLIIQPLWNKTKKKFPGFLAKYVVLIETYVPRFKRVSDSIVIIFNNLKHLANPIKVDDERKVN